MCDHRKFVVAEVLNIVAMDLSRHSLLSSYQLTAFFKAIFFTVLFSFIAKLYFVYDFMINTHEKCVVLQKIAILFW